MAKQPIDNQVKEVLSIISPDYLCELATALSVMSDWQTANGLERSGDYEEIAYLICEFAETHAENLRKINKKFPGLAKILKERMIEK